MESFVIANLRGVSTKLYFSKQSPCKHTRNLSSNLSNTCICVYQQNEPILWVQHDVLTVKRQNVNKCSIKILSKSDNLQLNATPYSMQLGGRTVASCSKAGGQLNPW